MGKIKFVANKNINKNTILVLVLISFAAFAFFAVNVVLTTVNTKDYKKVIRKVKAKTKEIAARKIKSFKRLLA